LPLTMNIPTSAGIQLVLNENGQAMPRTS
jgi:hypothetical protein